MVRKRIYYIVCFLIFLLFIFLNLHLVFGNSIISKPIVDQVTKVKVENGSNEFYKVSNEFYNEESNKVFLFCDASISDLDFSIRTIRKEARDRGFSKFKIVHDISKVPKLSTLLLFISPPKDELTSYYYKLNSYIGYIYEYSDNEKVSDLRIFSAVYIFGKSYEFSRFHNELDLFLTTQRQYRILHHPVRYSERSHVELMVKLGSLNQNNNISNVLMKFEKSQFPLNKFNLDVYGLPNDDQCKVERSIIAELKHWGVCSTIHVLVFQLLLGVHSKRMLILQQQDFQYGPWNHLFLPVSICDFFDGYDRYNLPYINTTYDPTLDNHTVLLNPGHVHYTVHKGNFVPTNITDLFSSPYAVNVFLINYFTTPTFQLREYINKQILDTFKLPTPSGMPNHCISIHVRHGDKGKEAKLYPFNHYYNVLKSLNTTIKDVFLMTDDDSIIQDANKLSKEEGLFKFHYLNTNRSSSDNKLVAHATFDPVVPRGYYGYEMMGETIIASKCEIIVCTMSSNVCRYISELQPLHENLKGKSIKYFSLDIAYFQDLSKAG